MENQFCILCLGSGLVQCPIRGGSAKRLGFSRLLTSLDGPDTRPGLKGAARGERRLCLFNRAGVRREARGTASGAGKSEARIGWVRFCVWWERDFGSRFGTDSWFGGKQGAQNLRVVRGTE